MACVQSVFERLLPFFFACPSRLASWFFSFAFSCWRTAFVSSSSFCPSRIESILLLILSKRTSCLSWTGSFAAIIRSRKNPNTCTTKRNSSEWACQQTTVKDRTSRDYSSGHLISVKRNYSCRNGDRNSKYGICHAHKDRTLSLGTRHPVFSILTRAFRRSVQDVWWRLQFGAVRFILRNPGFSVQQ